MNTNHNLSKFEKAFYSDGYRFGMSAIEYNLSEEELFLAIKQMYASVEELMASLNELSKKEGVSIQCKKGCSYCCHQPVYALGYEFQYLNNFLKSTLSTKEYTDVKIQAQNNTKELNQLSDKNLLDSKLPCPLLKNDSCSAYEARPMACRIYVSTNVNTCNIFYKNPANKSNYPALLEFPMRAGRMMNEGFKSALKTADLVAKEYRIDEGLLL